MMSQNILYASTNHILHIARSLLNWNLGQSLQCLNYAHMTAVFSPATHISVIRPAFDSFCKSIIKSLIPHYPLNCMLNSLIPQETKFDQTVNHVTRKAWNNHTSPSAFS